MRLIHISLPVVECPKKNRESKNYNIDVFAYLITNRLKME